MNEFLNAKSMVTPGVAGGLVMLITNTCANQFSLTPKWISLALSVLFGFLVVYILVAPLWQKGVLWIVNALIIFSMAMGTNQAGASLQSQSDTRQASGPYPTPAASPSPTPVARPSPSVRPSPAPAAHEVFRKAKDAGHTKEFFLRW